MKVIEGRKNPAAKPAALDIRFRHIAQEGIPILHDVAIAVYNWYTVARHTMFSFFALLRRIHQGTYFVLAPAVYSSFTLTLSQWEREKILPSPSKAREREG